MHQANRDFDEADAQIFVVLIPTANLYLIVGRMPYSGAIWASWCLKSRATQLLVQQLFQADKRVNIKAQRYYPFVSRIRRRIPLTKGQ